MSFGAVAASGDSLKFGLVGWYRMLGDGADSSGKGNTGTPTGTPALAADKFGNANSAYTLDDSSYFTLARTAGLPLYNGEAPGYSVAFWVKLAQPASGWKQIFQETTSGGNPKWYIGAYSGTANLFNVLNKGDGTGLLPGNFTGMVVADDTWRHYAWTDNAGTVTQYLNGVAAGSNLSYTPAAMGGPMNTARIGPFPGSVSDVRLYSRALTAAEVHTLYAAAQRI